MAKRILLPMELGEIIDETFDLYKQHFLLFAGIAGIIHLTVSIITYSFGPLAQFGGITLLWPSTNIVMAATTWAVSHAYLGRTPTILGSYRALKGRFWMMLAVMFVTYLIITAGTMMCIVPGIFFSLWFFFVAPVFMLEGKPVTDALTRSKYLSDGELGRIFVLSVVTISISYAITIAITAPASLLAGASILEGVDTGGLWGTFYGASEGLAKTLVAPVQVISAVLLYYDIRVRKEGFDLELLASSMNEPEAEVPVVQS